MFAEYNYVVENLTQMVKVEPHIRGCICDLKPCIRLCCVGDENNSSACIQTDTLTVPTHDEDEEIDLSGNRYGVLVGRPCAKMYKLEPQDYPDDRWYFVVSQVYLLLKKLASLSIRMPRVLTLFTRKFYFSVIPASKLNILHLMISSQTRHVQFVHN